MSNRPNRSKESRVEIVTETSPLNNRNHNTSEQIQNNSYIMDNDTKRVLIKMAFDMILLGCVGLPVLMFFLFGVPYKRGFNCNDESLMYPFRESTVTHEVLYTLGFGVPILCIFITEYIRWKLNMEPDRELKLFGRPIPIWMQHAYKFIGILLFGAACSQLTTDIAKYTIGRLRPHFFDVCKPVVNGTDPCTDPANLFKYIIDFTCSNENVSQRRIKEVRLSFLSGHSSFSMYTMVFAALYLQCRFDWRGSKLAKHFLQFAFVSMAWYTALSRISDYKHHWSDVLAGSLQGLAVSLLIVFGVSDLFKNKWRSRNEQAGSRYELDTSQNSRSN